MNKPAYRLVEPPRSRGKHEVNRWVPLIAIGLIAVGLGFAVPQFLPDAWSEKFPTVGPGSAPGRRSSDPVLVPFGELVVNLAEDRLTRYLRVNITLQVDCANELNLKRSLEQRKAILRSWLISYLSDKSLEEVRGAAGVNRARREIQDKFNDLLFTQGAEVIREVLFEEFSVQ